MMVTHAWKEDNEEFEDALDRYMIQNGVGDDASMWMCTFAQYQPKKNDFDDDIGPSVTEQLKLDPFAKVITSPGMVRLVAVHTSTADLYLRLWCPYELYTALNTRGVEVVAAASEQFLMPLCDKYDHALKQWKQKDAKEVFVNLMKKELWSDTSKAECSNMADEMAIREKITTKCKCKGWKDGSRYSCGEHCGFTDLSQTIRDLRRDLMYEIVPKAHIQQFCPVGFKPAKFLDGAWSYMWRDSAGDYAEGTRNWLMEKLHKWSSEWRSRVFVLVGVGGIGKSVLMAQVCLRKKVLVAAFHFFQHDDERKRSLIQVQHV